MTRSSETDALLLEQAEDAAAYLIRLVERGEVSTARSSLLNLGSMGMLVLRGMIARLSKPDSDQLIAQLTADMAASGPRGQQRTTLRKLAALSHVHRTD